ncbi:MAG: hypothetical protein JW861_07555 [Bacteroidales bacterium]|nr:hypothetical protein [Bacteroidales bacterium]
MFIPLMPQAQRISDSAMRVPLFYAAYAFQVPGGDMGDRFGPNSNIGGGFLYKTRAHWMAGADFNYLFGKDIKGKDELLANLRTDGGNIIDQAGNFASVNLFERGYYVTARLGKLFPIWSPNPNSGPFLLTGGGYLQHKIRIEVVNNSVPQLQGDYKRGYDRLTGGFTLSQMLGYKYLGARRLVNFFAAIEGVVAWTRPLRDVNFDTMKPDQPQKRMDLLWGIKAGWIIPIYTRMPEKYYFH